MVPEGPEVVVAVRAASCHWRPKVGRDDAQDVIESNLVVEDLCPPLGGSRRAQVLVTPAVAPNLVALGNHSLDDGRVSRLWVVDLALSSIVSDNEECGPHVVALEQIQQLRGVNVRPIVERQRDLPRHGAVADIDAVGHISERWPRDLGRVRTRRCLISVTRRAK